MHVEDGGSNKRNVYILTCLLVHLLKYILDNGYYDNQSISLFRK